MEPRALGHTDLLIPRIVLGTMARHDQDDRSRVDVIRAAIEGGLTTIDTAPLYGFGQAERQVAQALPGVSRDRVQILTKVGLRWDDIHGDVFFEVNDAGGRRVVRKDSRPQSIRWEVEQSLARLQLECLDLVQIHRPDVHTPIPETIGALLELRSEGKLHHVGVSNFSRAETEIAQRALGEVPLCSLQSEYNLVRRGLEQSLLPCVSNRELVCLHSLRWPRACSPVKQMLMYRTKLAW